MIAIPARKRSVATAAFALMLLPFCTPRNDKAARIDEVASAVHDMGKFSGAVLVAERGEVIYNKGFGLANHEWGIANGPGVKYRIASMTKAFTSLLVLQLVDEGKMDLQATIRDYLPEYPEKPGGSLTIHQLLSHTSGMTHYRGIPDFFPVYSRQPYTPQKYIELFWELDLEFEPGTEYSYSSFGYFLLGTILGEVTGKSYADLLQERILGPAGMEQTGMDDHLTLESNRASGYNPIENGFLNASFRDMSTAFSTGAMFSTTGDMFLWDRILDSGDLLPSDLMQLLHTPNIGTYAYGWNVHQMEIDSLTADSVTVIRHSGSTNGFSSYIIRLPDDDHLIVLLANTNPSNRNFWHTIVKILYDKPYMVPVPDSSQAS